MDEEDQNAATGSSCQCCKSTGSFSIALVTQPAPIDEFVEEFVNEGRAIGTLTHLEHDGLMIFIDHCSRLQWPLFLILVLQHGLGRTQAA